MGDAKRPSKDEADPRWVRGLYQLGLEVSSFQPAGNRERWWTSFERSPKAETERLQAEARKQPVEVELFGTRSEAGAYGHMGLYQREFRVQKLRFVKTVHQPGKEAST